MGLFVINEASDMGNSVNKVDAFIKEALREAGNVEEAVRNLALSTPTDTKVINTAIAVITRTYTKDLGGLEKMCTQASKYIKSGNATNSDTKHLSIAYSKVEKLFSKIESNKLKNDTIKNLFNRIKAIFNKIYKCFDRLHADF